MATIHDDDRPRFASWSDWPEMPAPRRRARRPSREREARAALASALGDAVRTAVYPKNSTGVSASKSKHRVAVMLQAYLREVGRSIAIDAGKKAFYGVMLLLLASLVYAGRLMTQAPSDPRVVPAPKESAPLGEWQTEVKPAPPERTRSP